MDLNFRVHQASCADTASDTRLQSYKNLSQSDKVFKVTNVIFSLFMPLGILISAQFLGGFLVKQ